MAQPGSVVRMIYRVLGEKHFQEGLQLYFARHKYGNTRTIDLWNAWKEAGSAFILNHFPLSHFLGSGLEAGFAW